MVIFAHALNSFVTNWSGSWPPTWDGAKKHKLDRKYHLAMGYNASKGTSSTTMVETDRDIQTQNYVYEDALQHQGLVLSQAHGKCGHERAGKDWHCQPVACQCHIREMLKRVECDHCQCWLNGWLHVANVHLWLVAILTLFINLLPLLLAVDCFLEPVPKFSGDKVTLSPSHHMTILRSLHTSITSCGFLMVMTVVAW